MTDEDVDSYFLPGGILDSPSKDEPLEVEEFFGLRSGLHKPAISRVLGAHAPPNGIPAAEGGIVATGRQETVAGTTVHISKAEPIPGDVRDVAPPPGLRMTISEENMLHRLSMEGTNPMAKEFTPSSLAIQSEASPAQHIMPPTLTHGQLDFFAAESVAASVGSHRRELESADQADAYFPPGSRLNGVPGALASVSTTLALDGSTGGHSVLGPPVSTLQSLAPVSSVVTSSPVLTYVMAMTPASQQPVDSVFGGESLFSGHVSPGTAVGGLALSSSMPSQPQQLLQPPSGIAQLNATSLPAAHASGRPPIVPPGLDISDHLNGHGAPSSSSPGVIQPLRQSWSPATASHPKVGVIGDGQPPRGLNGSAGGPSVSAVGAAGAQSRPPQPSAVTGRQVQPSAWPSLHGAPVKAGHDAESVGRQGGAGVAVGDGRRVVVGGRGAGVVGRTGNFDTANLRQRSSSSEEGRRWADVAFSAATTSAVPGAPAPVAVQRQQQHLNHADLHDGHGAGRESFAQVVDGPRRVAMQHQNSGGSKRGAKGPPGLTLDMRRDMGRGAGAVGRIGAQESEWQVAKDTGGRHSDKARKGGGKDGPRSSGNQGPQTMYPREILLGNDNDSYVSDRSAQTTPSASPTPEERKLLHEDQSDRFSEGDADGSEASELSTVSSLTDDNASHTSKDCSSKSSSVTPAVDAPKEEAAEERLPLPLVVQGQVHAAQQHQQQQPAHGQKGRRGSAKHGKKGGAKGRGQKDRKTSKSVVAPPPPAPLTETVTPEEPPQMDQSPPAPISPAHLAAAATAPLHAANTDDTTSPRSGQGCGVNVQGRPRQQKGTRPSTTTQAAVPPAVPVLSQPPVPHKLASTSLEESSNGVSPEGPPPEASTAVEASGAAGPKPQACGGASNDGHGGGGNGGRLPNVACLIPPQVLNLVVSVRKAGFMSLLAVVLSTVLDLFMAFVGFAIAFLLAALLVVLQLHRYALTEAISNLQVVVCFVVPYTFTRIVRSCLSVYAPHWAPACLWYIFLAQLFWCEGGRAKKRSLLPAKPSRVMLPLLLVAEGVSRQFFIMELSGPELLLVSFVLAVVKLQKLTSPVFLLSWAFQVLAIYCMDFAHPVCQYAQVLVSLTSLHAMAIVDTLDYSNAEGQNDRRKKALLPEQGRKVHSKLCRAAASSRLA